MLKQNLSQKLLQKLSPQQIQFIKLLQLSTQDFEQRLEQELMENPALMTAEEYETTEENALGNNEDEKAPEPEKEQTQEEFDDLGSDDFGSEEESFESSDDDLYDVAEYANTDDIDDYNTYGNNNSPDDDEGRKEYPFAESATFRESLLEQIQAVCQDEKEYALANQIIGSIEEDGYLRRPLSAIVNDLAFTVNIDTDVPELEKVLNKVQQLEPAGIAARSLQECLLLQLKRKDKNLHPELDLAISIIEDYIEDFTKKHYHKLIKSLKITEEELRDAIELITKLNPKPGDSSANVKTQYIVPDFIVVDNRGDLEVSLNSRNAPDLRISREYREALKDYEKKDKPSKQLKDTISFIKQKLDGAKWFIDSIKQRQNTLLTTMNAIVRYQYDFFLTGDEASLKPMILKDIADEVGLDVSTISRVANSKYVQTDFGIISLKFFFSEGITTEEGEEVSNREVKKILKEAIEGEDKSHPVPDEKLMEILKEKGYNIARRTVAKYREQLGIPVARLRKEI